MKTINVNTVKLRIIAVCLLLSLPAFSKPRPPQPPWPEATLRIYGFDSAYQRGPWKDVAINEETSVADSWSGHSLVREQTFIPSPVVIPVDVESKRPNFKMDGGAIRFWIAPNWSTAGEKSDGKGPGHLARFVELVSLDASKPEVKWSLCVNDAGDTIYLAGDGNAGTTIYLNAPIQFKAGDWKMITLGYSTTNTALWIDNELVAKGGPLPKSDWWETKNLGLVVGSDIYGSGDSVAEAQFEELTTLPHWPRKSDWQDLYFNATKRRTLLGTAGTKEEEQAKVAVLKSAGLLPEEYGTMAKSSGEGDGPVMLNSYASGTLWLEITGVSNNLAYLIVHGTTADVAYEILSKESLTNTEWTIEQPVVWGVEGQDWTPTTVAVGTRTNDLFFWARTLMDSDGGGLPDWWQWQYYGHLGVDPYGDEDGDGWQNLLEYQNQTNPNQFNTPHAPNPLIAQIISGNDVMLSWGTAGGNISEYVLLSYDWSIGEYVELARVSATNRIYVDAGAAAAAAADQFYYLDYGVYGICSNNEVTETETIGLEFNLPLFVMYGAARQPYVVFSVMPSGLDFISFNLTKDWIGTNTIFNLSATNFLNGIAALPAGVFGDTGFWSGTATGYLTNGIRSGDANIYFSPEESAFMDASKYLKANLNFLLRAATITHPFGFAGTSIGHSPSSDNYEFYHIQDSYGGRHPDTDNFLWLNFLWNSADIGAGYLFDTGAYYDRGSSQPPWNVVALGTPRYTWSAPLADLPVDPPVVVTNNPNLVLFDDLSLTASRANSVGLTLGANGFVSLSPNARNIYGLPINSAMFISATNGATTTIGAGGSATLGTITASFFQTQQPQLQTVGYYFNQGYPATIPGSSDFQITNISPMLVMSPNDFAYFEGYAKQAIINGYNNKFAYLGQYFDKALNISTNGIVTANETGILSEYGDFFATEVGRVALVTKPDIETSQRGTAVVYVVSFVLDKNRDGIMDLNRIGYDNTSYANRFTFWANNDHDRGHKVDCNIFGLNCDYEEDDLSEKEVRKLPAEQRVIDGLYTTNGLPAIPCKRDLEDYTRIWFPGLTELMSSLPTNHTVRLKSYSKLRFFRSAEASGSTNYLFNEAIADAQVTNSTTLYLGESSYYTPLVLNGKTNIGEHFIFCAAETGTDNLTLEVLNEHQQTIGSTTAYLDIKDIKKMYERWTVGERPNYPPTNTAQLAVNDLPPNEYWETTPTPFQYAPNTDTNTPYILLVHGWNMETWEKDRFAETAFKRLYWQGYKGRFGFFRWPTGNGFGAFSDLVTDANNYDKSEWQAWKSGIGLRGLLSNLNVAYPGNVRLLAHSMGNVVAGEALRTSNTLVHTYVAMQAAVPSHAYDGSTTVRTISPSILDNQTPNYYANYWQSNSPPYFAGAAGAANYLNFFNTNDYALVKWQIDQNLKPADSLGYGYLSSSTTNNFVKGVFSYTYLLFPVATFEIFSFCDESRCFALGAQSSVGGVFQTANEIDLNLAPFSYGTPHKGHSAQFRSNNMKQGVFWSTILEKTFLQP